MQLRGALFAVFVAATLAQASPASAQSVPRESSAGFVSASWEMAVPVYSFRNVQKDVSFRGVGFDARYFLHRNISVGGSMSIQHFHDEFDARTVVRPDGAVTAKVNEYTEVWQFRGIAHYYPLGRERVSPYLGVGVGYAWANRLTLVTDFSLQDTAGAFALTPEAGILVSFGQAVPAGLIGSLRYNFTTASPDRVDSLSYLSWTVGGFFGF